MRYWGRLKGKAASPQAEYEDAWMTAVLGDTEKALNLTESLAKKYKNLIQIHILQGDLGIFLDRKGAPLEALRHIPKGNTESLYRAYLNIITSPSFDSFGEECRLMWEAVKARRGLPAAPDLWPSLDALPNQLVRVDVAILVLEHRPKDRTPQRLLALQAIADRSCSESRRARLRALWPSEATPKPRDPEIAIHEWLNRTEHRTWILVGDRLLGPPTPPPEGLLGRLQDAGHVQPVQIGGSVWWGESIHWEGGPVGRFLTCAPIESALPNDLGLHLLAPWLAAMRPALEVKALPEGDHFPCDGSEPMATILQEAARVAPTTLPVLILGPSGTGKELMAREIHGWSGRTGHLVAVNCSAFAEGLLESELFGHVKGAFTGADRDRKGAIEMAEGGTLLLDEVADMSPRIQSMFLRVLQEHEVRRVGSERTQRVDVRFLAATHKGLDQLVATGAFRHDLLYRLQGAVLSMPSLTERRHELPRLLPRMLAEASRSLRRLPPAYAPQLAEALGRAPWPGNFRQLRHALERAILRCGPRTLGPEHFPELDAVEPLSGTWESATATFQRNLLLATLNRHAWNVSEASQDLGLTRVALYAALKRLGVDLPGERHRHRSRFPTPVG